MNYHAHIPAGVLFYSSAVFVSGSPLSVAGLIGSAFGGVLSDIDHPSGNSAVSSFGEKTLGKVGRVFGTIGKVFDGLILRPLTFVWGLFATKVFDPFYFMLWKLVGCKLGWSKRTPSEHRGGLTHSLFSILLFGLLFLPFGLVLGWWDFYVGLLLGILSHLFADSLCKSGIYYFWPWFPSIGFFDDTHKQGRGIRLLPVEHCVSTGKCPTKQAYKEIRDPKERKIMKKAYRKEKGWQWVFRISAIIMIILVLLGIGPGAGCITIAGNIIGTSPSYQQAATIERIHNIANESNDTNQTTQDNNTNNNNTNNNNNGINTTTKEAKGITTFTLGDLDANTLPKHVIKLPDESLYVEQKGPVTQETINDPIIQATQEEKTRILTAATAQRAKELPEDIQKLTETTGQTLGTLQTNAQNTTSGITGIFSNTNNTNGGIFDLKNIQLITPGFTNLQPQVIH